MSREGRIMTGADLLMETASDLGIEVCFANPGTTEMPLVDALDGTPKIRPILCLFEGVCTGAADGYARMSEKPAMALLHLGPGLANGYCNLHNARRGNTPVLVVVGEHSTWHKPYDPPLAMDIEAVAGTLEGWHRTTSQTQNLGQDICDAIIESQRGMVATLIVPFDLQTKPVIAQAPLKAPLSSKKIDETAIANAASLLKSGKKVVILLGGHSLSREGQMKAACIKAASGCDLIAEPFPARMEGGLGLPPIDRIPYLPPEAQKFLAPYEVVILSGTSAPMTFFGYENTPPNLLTDDQEVISLGEGHDVLEELYRLSDILDAPSEPPKELLTLAGEIPMPTGLLTGEKVCAILAALQPEGAIIMDESLTSGNSHRYFSAFSKPFTTLNTNGGAIGLGLPCATGAAVACPDRKVIILQADGSGLYTIQALWTQAKENLDVVTLIFSNQSYDILKFEASKWGTLQISKSAKKLSDLSGVDWVKLSESMGVPAVSVTTSEELSVELSKAIAEKGPKLIEMKLKSKFET